MTNTQSGLQERLRVLSLFSGIGGLDLGLERAGMEIVAHSEIDPYASRVLRKHWPDIPNLGDVTEATEFPDADVVAGGFPCQNISSAHTSSEKLGLAGPKSGLWREYRRVVDRVRPTWVIVENVSAWTRWVPDVRADLYGLGYASVPFQLSAGSFGAPHRRPRCFVVAHADSDGEPLLALHAQVGELRAVSGPDSGHWRQPAPDPVGMDDGIPGRMDRLACLGNAVVPQVAEWIGRQIVVLENGRAA